MKDLLVGVIPSGETEMHGVKQSMVEQLAEIVAKEACSGDLVLGYAEIYERSPELAEAIHNLFVSHHEVVPEIEIDIPAGSAVPSDGQWIEEGVWKRLKKYGSKRRSRILFWSLESQALLTTSRTKHFSGRTHRESCRLRRSGY